MKKLIFSDFDGTLTQDGELGAVFFEILDEIHAHGAELIIVSGRSLSWGHFLLTHFPLNYVIMEGGGVIIYKDDKRLLHEHFLVSQENLKKLSEFTSEIQHKFPGIPLSLDSYGRKSDRALEYSQMTETEIKAAENYMEQNQIHFSRSNVHINFWCGEISKYDAVMDFLRFFMKDMAVEDCMFFGDSMNDESMFEKFPDTVGVSNIDEVLNKLKFKPTTILQGDSNKGPF